MTSSTKMKILKIAAICSAIAIIIIELFGVVLQLFCGLLLVSIYGVAFIETGIHYLIGLKKNKYPPLKRFKNFLLFKNIITIITLVILFILFYIYVIPDIGVPKKEGSLVIDIRDVINLLLLVQAIRYFVFGSFYLIIKTYNQKVKQELNIITEAEQLEGGNEQKESGNTQKEADNNH